MAIVVQDLTLAAATLTNGARLASASAPFPERITTEADIVKDFSAIGTGNLRGIAFGADNASFIVTIFSSNLTKKYDLTGAELWSATTSGAAMVWRYNSTTLWVSRNVAASAFIEVDETTGATTSRTLPVSTQRQVFHVPGGTAGKGWCAGNGVNVREFNYPAGTATGRVITVGTAPNAVWPSPAGAATPSIFLLLASTIVQYRESDLAVINTWTVSGAGMAPGVGIGSTMQIGADGCPYVWTTAGQVDKFTTGAGAQKDVATRYLYSGADIRGVGQVASGGGNQQWGFLAWSDDGRYLAHFIPSYDQVDAVRGVRILNILTQRARWSVTASADWTLSTINLPGQHGNMYGDTVTWRPTTTLDFRRTRFYYQRIGVDGARVEFVPGEDLGALAVDNGVEIRIDADFYHGPGIPPGPPPYVEGASIVYDDGTVISAGTPPDVEAPAQVIAYEDTTATLAATATDDGTIVSYAWTFLDGPATPSITSPTSATTGITALSAVGTYRFSVAVTDDDSLTTVAYTSIVKRPSAANVLEINPGFSILNNVDFVTTATLSASEVTSDYGIDGYLWEITSQPFGASAVIVDPTQAAGFTSVTGLDTIGDYVFTVTATDTVGNTATGSVTIFVRALDPGPAVSGVFLGRFAGVARFSGIMDTP